MICTNCGKPISIGKVYYRLNNSGSKLCTKECVYDSFRGFYDVEAIKKGTREYKRHK